MSLKYFFEPKGIAIVGASREKEKPGRVIFEILLENRRRGLLKADLYPVNPRAQEILGVKCYKSIQEISGEVDLAIIVVPARIVPHIIEDAGVKGVKGVIIISAGFSEIGNKELEEEVKARAKKYGIRILGPNCIGVLSPWSGIDTIFLPFYKELSSGKKVVNLPRPKPGYVALLSQSGAVGTAAIDYMSGEGIGLSAFVSYGNKADIDEPELLDYFLKDPKTRVILMYVESIDDGRRFLDIASKVTLRKPIIALKAGRTKAGSKAAASHTAAVTGVDEVYSAAFRKAGIVRANDIEELFDFAKVLVMQPPSRGNRVGIITDGGGAGVMATDMAEIMGLNVPELVGETRDRLEELREKGFFPEFSIMENPVDLTGSVTSEMFIKATKILLESDEVDIVVVLALHQVPGIPDPPDLARKIGSLAYSYTKPIIAVDTGWSEAAILEREEFDKNMVPSYPIPERAIKAAWALHSYGKYLRDRGVYEKYIQHFIKFRKEWRKRACGKEM